MHKYYSNCVYMHGYCSSCIKYYSIFLVVLGMRERERERERERGSEWGNNKKF